MSKISLCIRAWHELGLVFLANFPQDSGIYGRDDEFEGDEEGLKLYFKWYSIDELDDLRIVPVFLPMALKSIPDTITHIVNMEG